MAFSGVGRVGYGVIRGRLDAIMQRLCVWIEFRGRYTITRVMTLDRKFQPILVEDRVELFQNGFFDFNITKLIQDVKAHPKHFPIEYIAVKTVCSSFNKSFDEQVIQAANYLNPIL